MFHVEHSARMSKSTKPRPVKTPLATIETLEAAARRSIRAVRKTGCTKASTDAGFVRITGKHPNRRGYQIFVTAEPWSDEAAIEVPESGGLVNRAREIVFDRCRAATLKSLERLVMKRDAERRKRSKKGGSK